MASRKTLMPSILADLEVNLREAPKKAKRLPTLLPRRESEVWVSAVRSGPCRKSTSGFVISAGLLSVFFRRPCRHSGSFRA